MIPAQALAQTQTQTATIPPAAFATPAPDSATNAAPAEDPASPSRIRDIIVTAQRRSEAMPLTISQFFEVNSYDVERVEVLRDPR